MIQAISAYRVGEMVFPTIQEAQNKELQDLLSDGAAHTETAKAVIDSIIAHTDEVVAILTCSPKREAPRKPRSDIGKKRALKDTTPTVL
jgi:hypothetical protein